MAAGRELWGWPKKLADCRFEAGGSGPGDRDGILFTTERPAGKRLLTVTMTPERPATMEDVGATPHLTLRYIPGAGELCIFLGAMAGAGLGFLWFNAYPAEVFMGDVGALALGGALGTVAVIVRQEIVLAVMGGVFVAETLAIGRDRVDGRGGRCRDRGPGCLGQGGVRPE